MAVPALTLGDYHSVQSQSSDPELTLTLLKNSKFRCNTSTSTSRGFYDFYLDTKAKGRWEIDPTGRS
jgi:hypothetical protein